MILMAIDHVRVFSGVPAGGPTLGVFFTRWITHFCAPAFIFLAGTSIFLYSRRQDRKSTRLNSSHLVISYAVFCLKKKKHIHVLQNWRITHHYTPHPPLNHHPPLPILLSTVLALISPRHTDHHRSTPDHCTHCPAQ